MNKHTPGDWYVTGEMTRYINVRIGGGLIQEVASCGPTEADDGYGPQQEANARLIAAAPDLLEAAAEAERVIEILWASHHANRADAALDALRTAIAKATGEQP